MPEIAPNQPDDHADSARYDEGYDRPVDPDTTAKIRRILAGLPPTELHPEDQDLGE